MKIRQSHWFLGMLLVLGILAALACGKKADAPAPGEKAVAEPAPLGPNAPQTAAAFELKMRVLEGVREGVSAAPKPVTSSFLKFMTFANYELEEDVKAEQQIKSIYNLKDVGLLTEATLSWVKGQSDKAFHLFRLNGQEYAVFITPGKVVARNQFQIEVFEQSTAGKSSLLDTEFSLPDKTATVFGFETSELKPYFITLRVERWVGEPAASGEPAAATVDVAGEPVRAGGRDRIKPPKLIREVQPVYPENARQARVEGIVIIEATTDTYGRVASAKVLRSIPLLDQAAMEAVKQWVYEPMIIDGKPRPVVFTVTMRFQLDENKKPGVSGTVGGVVGGVEGGTKEGVEGGVEGGVVGGVEKPKALDEFARGAAQAVKDTKPPQLIKEVQPVYPEAARAAGVSGVVILGVKTDETGRVADVIVLRSIPLLDQAAIDAVRQWVYEPFVQDGKTVPVVFTVTVRFQLK